VPNFTIANDGKFYMELSDFVRTFEVFMINYIQDKWKINTHYVKGDDGRPKSYFFTNPKVQDIYLGVDLYSDRFYPYGCKKNSTDI
jgi:hypothetical protein